MTRVLALPACAPEIVTLPLNDIVSADSAVLAKKFTEISRAHGNGGVNAGNVPLQTSTVIHF